MKKRRNGKSQFTAVLNEISVLLKEGQTGRYIHEQLTDSSKITISYPQFQRYLAAYVTPDKGVRPTHGKTILPSGNKPVEEITQKKDIFKPTSKVLHNPSMTDERRKEIFGE